MKIKNCQFAKIRNFSQNIFCRWFQRKDYSIAIKCYKKALTYYNDVPTNHECSSAAEYKELMLLLEERLRVMRQVANIFKRIANLIQSGQISI